MLLKFLIPLVFGALIVLTVKNIYDRIKKIDDNSDIPLNETSIDSNSQEEQSIDSILNITYKKAENLLNIPEIQENHKMINESILDIDSALKITENISS